MLGFLRQHQPTRGMRQKTIVPIFKYRRLALTQEAQQKTTVPNAGLPLSAPTYNSAYATHS